MTDLTDEQRQRYDAWLAKLAAETPESYALELLQAGSAELEAVKRVRSRYGLGVQAALELVHRVFSG